MTLQRTLGYIRDAAKSFEGGTQIVGREQAMQASRSNHALEDLVQIAKGKGATPYEIMRAFQGEVIGESFLCHAVTDDSVYTFGTATEDDVFNSMD